MRPIAGERLQFCDNTGETEQHRFACRSKRGHHLLITPCFRIQRLSSSAILHLYQRAEIIWQGIGFTCKVNGKGARWDVKVGRSGVWNRWRSSVNCYHMQGIIIPLKPRTRTTFVATMVATLRLDSKQFASLYVFIVVVSPRWVVLLQRRLDNIIKMNFGNNQFKKNYG